MRRTTYGAAVSLDGFLAGADGSIDWLHFSKDVQEVMTDYWKEIDTLLWGRKTYDFSVAMNPSSVKKSTDLKSPGALGTMFSRARSRLSTMPTSNL